MITLAIVVCVIAIIAMAVGDYDSSNPPPKFPTINEEGYRGTEKD